MDGTQTRLRRARNYSCGAVPDSHGIPDICLAGNLLKTSGIVKNKKHPHKTPRIDTEGHGKNGGIWYLIHLQPCEPQLQEGLKSTNNPIEQSFSVQFRVFFRGVF
jgi:hypothetical protein